MCLPKKDKNGFYVEIGRDETEILGLPVSKKYKKKKSADYMNTCIESWKLHNVFLHLTACIVFSYTTESRPREGGIHIRSSSSNPIPAVFNIVGLPSILRSIKEHKNTLYCLESH